MNISQRPAEWRSNRSLEILRDIDGMYRLIEATLDLTREQATLVRRLRRRNRNAAARTVVAMIRSGASIDLAVVNEIAGSRTALLADCVRVAAAEVSKRTVMRAWRSICGTERRDGTGGS